MPSGVSAVGEVVETRFGKTDCTCWAMKPNCGTELLAGSIQLKVTGLRALISASELEPSRSWMLVFSRSSEFWVRLPAKTALPVS